MSQYQRDADRMMGYYKTGAVIFVVILITVFYITYYHSRSKELAFLKVNGYTNNQITYILTLENFIRLFMCILPSIILNLIINIGILHIDSRFVLLTLNTIATSFIVTLIPYIFSVIYVYYLKPIEIYRK